MQSLDASPKTAEPVRLSIIIVTYNSAAVLPGLLDSIPVGLEGIENFETIVADNDSHDDSLSIANAHPTQPKIVKLGRNAGYAAAVNAGAAVASKDAHLLILNPDVRLHPGVAKLLVDRLADPSVGITVPRNLDSAGKTSWSIRREPSNLTAWSDAILGGTWAARIGIGEMVGESACYERESVIDWATGCILAVSARAREIVGNWDESFFLYMEEVDYMRRVRERGFSVVYLPKAEALHIGGEYRENARLYGLLSANRIRYHRRHHGVLSTAAFRLSIILGEGLRAFRGPPGHKAAVQAALRPSKWPAEYQPSHTARPAGLARSP